MGNRPINRRPWRRAPWRRRLKPGEKGWINGVTTKCGFVPLEASYTCEPGDPDVAITTIEVISGAELAEHEGNVKCLRIVGDMILSSRLMDSQTAPQPVREGTLVRIGAIVVDADMSSGAEVLPKVDPTDIENADRSWMWLHTEFVESHYSFDAAGDIAGWQSDNVRIPIDIGVQRRLRNDQRLVMYATCTNSGYTATDEIPTETVDMALNLRCFIAF